MEQKKHPKVNLEKKRGLYAALGLLVALTMVLSALEFRMVSTFEKPIGSIPEFPDEIIEIIPVSIPKAPPPAIKKETISKVISSILIDDNGAEEPIAIVPLEIDPEDMVFASNTVKFSDEIVEEIDPIVYIPEVMPQFPGGIDALRKYLSKEMKYPKKAIYNGISGRVNLSFVVDKEGNISDVKIEHGLGGGCDEEAVRVVEAMPKWKPGKMGDKKVRVKYYLPIDFKLR
jgi:protein TonB